MKKTARHSDRDTAAFFGSVGDGMAQFQVSLHASPQKGPVFSPKIGGDADSGNFSPPLCTPGKPCRRKKKTKQGTEKQMVCLTYVIFVIPVLCLFGSV